MVLHTKAVCSKCPAIGRKTVVEVITVYLLGKINDSFIHKCIKVKALLHMQCISRAEATLIVTIPILFHSQFSILSLCKSFMIRHEVGTFVDADCTFDNKGSFAIHSLPFDPFHY